MRARWMLAAAAAALLAGCGTGAEESAPPPPMAAVVVAAAQPATTTTTAPTTTTTATTSVPPSTEVSTEPPMPRGARHGDQKEIVDEFAAIQQETDCDTLNARRDQYDYDETQMMATRSEQGHRARAELDTRWAAAVDRQLVAAGCVDMAYTP